MSKNRNERDSDWLLDEEDSPRKKDWKHTRRQAIRAREDERLKFDNEESD